MRELSEVIKMFYILILVVVMTVYVCQTHQPVSFTVCKFYFNKFKLKKYSN